MGFKVSALKSIDFPEATHRLGAPENWNSEEYGECEVLATIKQSGIYFSYWRLSWRQRILILLGFPIRLAIVGMQPPVALEIVEGAGR